MEIRSSINTIRKFWNFLEGLYPILGWFRKRGSLLVVWAVGIPIVQRTVNRLQQSSRVSAFKSLSESFVWADFSKQRLQLQELSLEALAVLRPLFLASMVLVLLLPFTWTWIWPIVPSSGLEGAETAIAGWSVVLWGICTTMGWACLLAGTSAANRTSFAAAAIFSQYILAIMTVVPNATGTEATIMVLCRWWIGLTTLWVSALCQRRLSGMGRAPGLYSLLTCCAVGTVAGVYLWRSLPWASALPGQNLKFGIAFGLLLGSIFHLIARIRSDSFFARLFFEPFRALPRTAYALILINGLWLLTALLVLGLPQFAQAVLSGHKYLMTHFWPLWYFLGVGMIFKVLRNSNVVSQSLREIIHPSFFVPAIILFFLSGFLLTGSYHVFIGHSINWPDWLLISVYRIYSWSKDWFWQAPGISFTMEWMFWVFLFDAASMVWLGLRRRMAAESLASLFFLNILCFLLIYEYFFQSFSFLRTPGHSMILCVFFSFSLLWLIQGSTHSIRIKSSQLWPSEARMAVFGSAILFALLEIHARTAVHDFRAMTEVFWFMYRGIIDVGLPFGLYVYASRRFGELPLPVGHLFTGFCTGALLTMPLNFLEHLVMAGGSWVQMSRNLSVLIGQGAGYPQVTPIWWGPARAVLVVLVLGGTAAVTRRIYRDDKRARASILFSVISVGLGLSAFSNIQISLLLPFTPPRWEWYWQPVYTSLLLEYPLLFLYLSFGLPAILLGLTASAEIVSARRWIAGITGAFLIHVLIAWVWPAHKPLLDPSGLAGTLMLAGLALTAVLIHMVRSRVDALTQGIPEAPSQPSQSAIGSELPKKNPLWMKIAVSALFLFVFTGLGYWQWHSVRIPLPLQMITLDWLTSPVPVPQGWLPIPSNEPGGLPSAGFIGPAAISVRPMLFVSAEHDEADFLPSLLLRKEKGNPPPGYRRSWFEDWHAYYDGAVAAHFSFELILNEKTSHPMIGISLFLPLGEKQVAVLTLVDSPDNRDARTLDMIKIVRMAAETWPGQARFINTRRGRNVPE